MCLKIDRLHHPFLRPKVARKNIPCYKVVVLKPYCEIVILDPLSVEDSKFTIITSIMETPLNTKCLRVTGVKAEEYDYIHFKQRSNKEVIHGGAIHSFKTFEKCIEYQDGILGITAILRAYIPKGTKYYIGRDGDYASEMIKFY